MTWRLEHLTPEGKEELALAVLLWKDFKSQGSIGVDVELFKQAVQIASMLGVEKQFHELITKLPPMRIAPK